MKILVLPAVAGTLLALSGVAMADTPVSAVTDLNVRAGPGPQFPVIGVLPAGQSATLTGCIQGSNWCTIAEATGPGWVYSDYVTADFGGRRVILTERPASAEVAVVSPPMDGTSLDATYTGSIVPADPIDAVVTPPQEVRTYIGAHPLEPVYLEGEVVTGAILPDTVELRTIPDYDYRYVYVNGQQALIDPATRRVVYVVR